VTRVGVVGCGLIGGSVLRRLGGLAGFEVVGFDPRAEVRAAMSSAGFATLADLDEIARASEIVVVAAPPAETVATVARLLHADPEVIVTDTASVKAPIVAGIGVDPRFVPGHPLAGREQHGWDAATPDLFNGAMWALCPEHSAAVEPIAAVIELVLALGASAYLVGPSDHDVAVGFSSHAPHIIANATARATPPELRERVAVLSGGGLRDGTRVAVSDGVLWRDIVSANRKATLDGIVAHQGRLEEMRRAIEASDWGAFDVLWSEGRRATEALLTIRWSEVTTTERDFVALTTSDLFAVCERGGAIRGFHRLSGGRTTLSVTAPN
jgi:prephenate dehydrogenase